MEDAHCAKIGMEGSRSTDGRNGTVEADRIKACGGRIKHGRLCHPKFSPEVLSLSVSRSIGDVFFKDAKFTGGLASGLTAEPYITTAEVCTSDVVEQFLLIGCDGLWDTVNYQEA